MEEFFEVFTKVYFEGYIGRRIERGLSYVRNFQETSIQSEEDREKERVECSKKENRLCELCKGVRT